MTASLNKWYEEHGRHQIFAGGKKVDLPEFAHDLVLNEADVNAEANHTLDDLGIAKTAGQEKARARDAKLKDDANDAQMARLYRQHILGEDPNIVSTIAPAKPVKEEEKEAETVSGD
jgi:hypothetical protein